jgi:hypothetical protein
VRFADLLDARDFDAAIELASRVTDDHRLPQRHRVDSGTLTTNDVGCSGGGFSLHQNSCAAARSARPEKR